MNKIFFDNTESILRTLIVTILAYICLIILLRVSGKRTLSKMNAFDFVVTVALGSTLATVLLNKSVALADGVLAMALLIGLQYLITFLSVRSPFFSKMVKATPTLLVYRGEMLHAAMKKQRVNEDEIHAIIREKGMASVEDADAVVLETDGSLTVVKNMANLQSSTMGTVHKPDGLDRKKRG
jgi:uncharacterized membrane protein YcaP (DUF421 family)